MKKKSVSCLVVSDSWHRGLQAIRLLCPWNSLGKNTGWVAIPFSRGSSQPRDQPRDQTWVTHIACRFFTVWANWGAFKKRRNSQREGLEKKGKMVHCSTLPSSALSLHPRAPALNADPQPWPQPLVHYPLLTLVGANKALPRRWRRGRACRVVGGRICC